MTLLPDTSIWVEYLRGNEQAETSELDEQLERESVLMCGPVVAELLAGTAPEHREDLWLVLGSLPWADLDRRAWRQVGEVADDLRPISFFALCEHHALPFHGRAHVGYVAHDRIIGISKLTRLVRVFANRFTVQERIGQEVADHLVGLLGAHGVAVHLEATHLCTQMRGVREENSRTWTSFWRGSYEEEPGLRDEFLRATEHR